jgi:hypothetical protein
MDLMKTLDTHETFPYSRTHPLVALYGEMVATCLRSRRTCRLGIGFLFVCARLGHCDTQCQSLADLAIAPGGFFGGLALSALW